MSFCIDAAMFKKHGSKFANMVLPQRDMTRSTTLSTDSSLDKVSAFCFKDFVQQGQGLHIGDVGGRGRAEHLVGGHVDAVGLAVQAFVRDGAVGEEGAQLRDQLRAGDQRLQGLLGAVLVGMAPGLPKSVCVVPAILPFLRLAKGGVGSPVDNNRSKSRLAVLETSDGPTV